MHTLVSRLVSVLCLLVLTSGAVAANTLEVSSVRITVGDELDIPVMYQADEDFVGFQTEVTLPEGLAFSAPNAYAAADNAGSSTVN